MQIWTKLMHRKYVYDLVSSIHEFKCRVVIIVITIIIIIIIIIVFIIIIISYCCECYYN